MASSHTTSRSALAMKIVRSGNGETFQERVERLGEGISMRHEEHTHTHKNVSANMVARKADERNEKVYSNFGLILIARHITL